MIRIGNQIRLTPEELKRFRHNTGLTEAPKTIEEYNRAYEKLSLGHDDAARLFDQDANGATNDSAQEDLVSSAACNRLWAAAMRKHKVKGAKR
jgi:hypothetical protein